MSKEVDYAIKQLFGKVLRDGCNAYNALLGTSEKCPEVYEYLDEFFSKMSDQNSYIRTRALGLICANARWDEENRIDGHIDELLSHITDEKPITARQFIKSLPELAAQKPNLKEKIITALKNADFSVYPESMSALAAKDAAEAVADIEAGVGKEECDRCGGEAAALCKRFGVSF